MSDEAPWIDLDAMVASFRERASVLLDSVGSNVVFSCEPDPPSGRTFLAEATAETPIGQVRITYGDREFEIRTFVHPRGMPAPLELGCYLDAMGGDPHELSDSMWVNSEGRLEGVLEAHAVGLRACLEALSSHPETLWEAAEHRRRTLHEEAQAQLRRDGLRRASAQAADAFRGGRFAEVVELLGPYDDLLSEAQRKKLSIARARSVRDG